MTTVKELHRQAMDIAHEAIIARDAGDANKADQLTIKAFDLELMAAKMVPSGQQAEPTRSILYRSAASLAFQANQYDEAIRLIATGLTGYPPPKIKHDLLNLLDQVKFKEYLTEAEYQIEDNGLLVTIRGKAVGIGLILYEEFKKRYDNTSSLIDKTTQRLTNRPYKSGQDKVGYRFEKMIEVPLAQNSFAMTLKLSTPQTPSLLLPQPKDVIDEVIYGIELVGEGRESDLQRHINDEPYYKHFVNIVRAMAPDGENIDHIGLASSRRNASLSRTRDNIIQLAPPIQEAVSKPKEYKPIEIIGRLAFADDISDNSVGIEVENGKEMKIKLTEGIDDIVVQYWNKNVKVVGVYDGEYIYASDVILDSD